MIVETVRLRLRNSRRSSRGCFGRKAQNTNATMSRTPIVAGTPTFVEKKVPSSGMELTP